jgi:hypothetical protein
MKILANVFLYKKKHCLVPFSRFYQRLLIIKIKGSVKFEVFMGGTMKSTVICGLMPSCMAYSLTLKVETARSLKSP